MGLLVKSQHRAHGKHKRFRICVDLGLLLYSHGCYCCCHPGTGRDKEPSGWAWGYQIRQSKAHRGVVTSRFLAALLNPGGCR